MPADQVDPCADCYALVGAGPLIPPHSALRRAPLQNDDRRKDVVVCSLCGVLWRLGPLGWSRMVRAIRD